MAVFTGHQAYPSSVLPIASDQSSHVGGARASSGLASFATDAAAPSHCLCYRDAFMAIKQDLLMSFVDCVERNGARLATPRTTVSKSAVLYTTF